MMSSIEQSASPPWQQPEIIQHSQRLLHSFQHWTGKSLLTVTGSPETIAQALFEAPFVVVSHGTQADPILNYGNLAALELWQLDWSTFTQTPSRQTAQPDAVPDREQFLARAKLHGFIDDYHGIRIAKNGQRFWIRNVVLWNVLDENNHFCGQAATFDRWEFLQD